MVLVVETRLSRSQRGGCSQVAFQVIERTDPADNGSEQSSIKQNLTSSSLMQEQEGEDRSGKRKRPRLSPDAVPDAASEYEAFVGMSEEGMRAMLETTFGMLIQRRMGLIYACLAARMLKQQKPRPQQPQAGPLVTEISESSTASSFLPLAQDSKSSSSGNQLLLLNSASRYAGRAVFAGGLRELSGLIVTLFETLQTSLKGSEPSCRASHRRTHRCLSTQITTRPVST